MTRRKKQVEPKQSNRKYHTVVFWNVLAGISISSQQILNIVLKEDTIKLPLEVIIGIAGVMSAAYLGVNIVEKKVTGMNAAKDLLGISVPPKLETDSAAKTPKE